MQLQSKKDKLAAILMNRFLEPLLAFRRKSYLSILAYHSVQPYAADYPYNTEIISAYPEIFDDQMAFVAKHFNVTNFKSIVQIAKAQSCSIEDALKELPPNSLIITFDDGYADNLLTVLPILQNHQLTAVVYVATDFVDEQRLFWFDEVAYFIRHMPEGRLDIFDGQFSVLLDNSDRETQRRSFGRFLQTITDQERLKAICELQEKAGFDVRDEHFKFAAPMSWDQVIALHQAGIEIGSHTKNHGFLDAMNPTELKEQILQSKAHIESKLGENIVSFSYPNGNFHEGVVKAVEDAGYSFAVSYRHAVVPIPVSSPLLLPRIHVETDVSIPLFKANLLLPGVFLR